MTGVRVIIKWLWAHGVMASMLDFAQGDRGSCDYHVLTGHDVMASMFDFHQVDRGSCDYQVVMGP